MSNYVTFRFVIKVNPDGNFKIFREDKNTTLSEAYLAAQSEQLDSEILRTVQVQVKIPNDKNKPKEPDLNINIKLD